MSVSPRTSFGLHFTKEHQISNSYEEIDERLFDNYLEISGRKNSKSSSFGSSDVSPCLSEEESDSSHHQYKQSVIGSGRRTMKSSSNNQKKREPKNYKKEELDSDNESIRSSKKSSKSINKKSSVSASSNSNQDESEKKQKSLYKTELCRNWEETNHCRYGMKCQYAHGAADLREIDRHPKYKTQKCRTFHQTGSCPYGNRCTFRHFNLPGDALEMKNLEKEEEEKRQKDEAAAAAAAAAVAEKIKHEKQAERPSIFSTENKKMLQQSWFLDSNSMSPLSGLESNGFPRRNMMMNQFSNSFDPEDSLLPSNAESLLPHQLLFDLESPEEEEQHQPARCPLRNYVNLPSFSNFQVPHHLPPQHQQNQQQQECKTFFRPWLF
ncbi:hypothetical protein HMPREF1544_05131 [Mucor circinelloides 1006PhL]|uniref:C3H1-type domain-containing protein n=1 Tax=Mucor circinelloides f. circinelloides (strain 1006PhL) TaxID=1220926 RepID=S2JE16_MUCC1|nr:hypothetical protein HMPREF1544_05131 [Mucor circinelloides 1006PhL]KAG1122772.1 hypothetical protein G6F42_011168 [Rhizopus arrhizus]